MNFRFNNLICLIAACTLMLGVASQSQAGQIDIGLLDVDLIYNSDAGGQIYDIKGVDGGNLSVTESDQLGAAEINGDTIPGVSWGDFLLDGVGTLAPGLNTVGTNGDSFGFDWFNAGGAVLELNFDTLDVLLNEGVMFITGMVSSLDSQNLPGGMVLDTTKPIGISYVATLPMVTRDMTGAISQAFAKGALSISGTMVPAIPEPTTFGLAALALFGFVGRRRR